MYKSSDLMLILEPDPESRGLLCAMAERLGCDHIEPDTLESVQEVLAIRRPTLAVLSVDRTDVDCLALIKILADHDARPATLLVGANSPRVLASVKRAAEARGLPILGVACRPLDPIDIENMVSPRLLVAPPVAREELERALAEQQLTLMYQPKLAVDSTVVRIQGVEALVRWQHPRRGLLQPRQFLTAVEDYGLMSQLTDFVITEAVRQAGQWRARGLPLEIVVNLSTKLVKDREFPERLAVLLQENDFPPQFLVLDVTESPSLDDRNLLLDVFARLRILGVGLSLDNFGTGQSSLTELYRMPFSEIKVDHSMIADVAREHEARVIVKAIVNLAHDLGLTACAEGVETSQILEFVRSAGFDTAQGRFFCEPVSAVEVDEVVRGWPSMGPAATGSWRMRKPRDFDGATTTLRTIRTGSADGK
jgi:EAL domain-containing protein (putative c-di-GMP-specific phosphodiesterase class I)